MCERVRLPEAAKELGVSQQSVREHMKRGLWDLGTCSRLKKTGKKQWEYHIYRTKLNRQIGKLES